MLVLIDNYDSFTYNLVQYLQILGQDVLVVKNDEKTIEAIEALKPSHLVISPGPKGPEQAGISLEAIDHFYQHIPILGICLGHQCLAHAFGATISQAEAIIHGKTSLIHHHQQRLFKGIANPFRAMRYHSLAIVNSTLSQDFAIDAYAGTTIMAISHRRYPVFGLQFHPESILSEYGQALLANFLAINS